MEATSNIIRIAGIVLVLAFFLAGVAYEVIKHVKPQWKGREILKMVVGWLFVIGTTLSYVHLFV